MKIHIGNRETLKTKCDRKITRHIWWVSDETRKPGPFGSYIEVDPKKSATCTQCCEG